jgi:hypothetical protein
MIGQSGPAHLSVLLADLHEAFAGPAAQGSGVAFEADLTALWAEALREAADMARTAEARIVALTVQRDAGIARIGALSHANTELRARLPALYRVPEAGGTVVDLSEAFRREQARRRPRPVDCQGDGA